MAIFLLSIRATFVAVICALLSGTPEEVSAIVRGKDTYPLRFFAHIHAMTKNQMWTCGGFLLEIEPGLMESDIVVTAAHCACVGNKPIVGTIRVQLAKFRYTDKGNPEAIVDRVFCHPRALERGHMFDVAILRLQQVIPFGEDVSGGVLPPMGSETPPEGTKCTAFGFGPIWNENAIPPGKSEYESKYQYPSTLQRCELEIMKIEEQSCNRRFPGIVDPDHMICMVGTSMTPSALPCSTWIGDSGGPIKCDKDEQEPPIVRGIVSFGGPGAGEVPDENHPRSWTNVQMNIGSLRTFISNTARNISKVAGRI